MIPAKGFYGLKTGSDEFFRYTAPKIVKCQVYESSQKIFLDEMSAPFPSVILESGTAQMPHIGSAGNLQSRRPVNIETGNQ